MRSLAVMKVMVRMMMGMMVVMYAWMMAMISNL